MNTHSNTSALRLTRRGRRVISSFLVSVMVLTVTPMLAGFAGASNQQSGNGQVATFVTVQPGDTLWAIALELAPERDPREVVWEIKQINNLTDGLLPGEQLRIPTLN